MFNPRDEVFERQVLHRDMKSAARNAALAARIEAREHERRPPATKKTGLLPPDYGAVPGNNTRSREMRLPRETASTCTKGCACNAKRILRAQNAAIGTQKGWATPRDHRRRKRAPFSQDR